MLTLSINTCFPDGQLCLFDDHTFVGEKCWSKPLSHSEVITSEFLSLCELANIKPKNIEHYSCVIGPGSFTGIRVGVNFCRALAFSNNKKVSAINSLVLLAANCSDFSLPILSTIDAQKNSIFLSSFRGKDYQPDFENSVLKLQNLADFLKEDYTVCGSAFDKYQDHLSPSVLKQLRLHAHTKKPDLKKLMANKVLVSSLKPVDWFQLQPLYIKDSAPEELLKSKD